MQKFANLFPEDLPRIIQRSQLVLRDGKWREVRYKRSERTASGVYNFVTLEEKVFICRASARVGGRLINHVDLAMGRDVDYAGRLYFSGRAKRGILRKWTNESGHYRPTPELMSNAGLPEELFELGQFKSLISVISHPDHY
ncbi:MAG: hypothetical protein RMY28_023950 [Nostoc sp. ChiSLP01]|nr:hypothetical protein [Nostoc sp. CmiSLP01]MDZ8289364.1 hypothetical protein [Nostoc sp. ChiSLP01]